MWGLVLPKVRNTIGRQIVRIESLLELAWLHRLLAPLLLIVLMVDAYLAQSGSYYSDFLAYYSAGHMITHDPGALYHYDAYDLFEHSIKPELLRKTTVGYLYPPTFAILLAPFSLLPYPLAFLVWSSISILCIVLSTRVLARLSDSYGLAHLTPFLKTIVMGSIVSLFVISNGQVSLLICLWFSLLLLALHKRMDAQAALYLFAIAQIKPHLALPLFLWQLGARQWRFCAIVVICQLIAVFVSMCLIDIHVWESYLSHLSAANSRHLEVSARIYKMVNLRGWLTPDNEPHRMATHLAWGAYIVLSAFCLLTPFVSRVKLPASDAMAIIAPLAFFTSPWLHIHDLIILAPACVVLTAFLHQDHRERYMLPVYYLGSYAMGLAVGANAIILYGYRILLLWLCGVSVYVLFQLHNDRISPTQVREPALADAP